MASRANHRHNLNCISPTSSIDPKLAGRLWFCSTLGQHLEGPDPLTDLRRELAVPQDERLRKIAAKHGFTKDAADRHVLDVWSKLQSSSLPRQPAVEEAWLVLPGSYSYYDAARAMAKALA